MSDNILPSQAHMDFLWLIRKYELDLALEYFPVASETNPYRLLELGAGTGQQAKYLSELGYQVSAIDLPSSSYKDARLFAIKDYDGKNIPAADEEFDIIFSSNVLEHVIHIDEVLKETCRTLKPNGIAIHIVPSPSCRFWSIPAHYIWLMRRIFSKFEGAFTQKKPTTPPRTPQSGKEWIGTLFPLRHGERGCTVTEPYYLSQHYWKRKFETHGFKVKKIASNNIFYTMSNGMGTHLPLNKRRKLSSIFGSSCFIYITGKN